MDVATLSYETLHNHGEMFANMFRARHRTFIVQYKWNLPEANAMEFDQFATPVSRWLAVDQGGQVLAGVRRPSTTHRCGICSYRIRDAQAGLLDTSPSNLLFEIAPVAGHVWESSQVIVSEAVPANLRLRVQMQLIHEMVVSARELGATLVLGLIPENALRLARRNRGGLRGGRVCYGYWWDV